ncbi:DUF6420 family protein [Streptomyces decoyicus]|uniref:DUF6420 family protein n=1 Tax=Streptomyces decoyicus TaxID=249567 RepID=UPI0033D18B15
MTIEHRGAAGPYTQYDHLPGLHATETGLPLLHPYATVAAGRYVTPGGGRLTVRTTGAHFLITLDHLGCPAQLTEAKTAAYRRLGLAAEGHCLHAGCRHHGSDAGAVLRSFHLRSGSIDLTAFVRAVLAVELGDERPTDRLLKDAEALAGPVRPTNAQGKEDQEEAS